MSNIEKMYVTMGGKKEEVGVSARGTFYLVNNSELYANTLQGLSKKIKKLESGKIAVPVEHTGTLEQGLAIGRKGAEYIVRWENGKTSSIDIWSLRRPTTEEERNKLAKLEKEHEENEEAYNESNAALNDMLDSLEIDVELRAKFRG